MDQTVADLLRAATLALSVPGRHGPRLGTGFLVAPGIVATCAHVLSDGRGDLPATVTARQVDLARDVELETVADWYPRDRPGGLDLAFLRAHGDLEATHVLLSSVVELGDPLWTYAHPSGMFREGQSAAFRYEGPSRAQGTEGTLLRVAGTPVTGGYSGGGVLNRRTGAVCGMLCLSNEQGSAHLLGSGAVFGAAKGGSMRTRTLPREDDGLVAVEEDALLGVPANGSGQGQALHVAAHRGQVFW